MRGGTYLYGTEQFLQNKSGTEGNLIKLWAYPGEVPIFSPTSGYTGTEGILFSNADYIHLKGMEITRYTQRTGGAFY